MMDLLGNLSHWISSFAESEWALYVIGIHCFTESIFNPIPPDPLLITASLFKPHMALWFAGVATLTSVAGAMVGYWIGNQFGRPLLYRMAGSERIIRAETLINKFGVWAVFLSAFTPIPYKVFAILAGVLKMNRRMFLLVSLAGRGLRFMLIGILILRYGETITEFLDHRFEQVTIIFSVVIVLMAIAVFVSYRYFGHRKDAL